MALLGVGSLGLLIVSERGREVVRWLAETLEEAPEQMLVWNDAAQRELESIQDALNHLSATLGAAVEPGRTL